MNYIEHLEFKDKVAKGREFCINQPFDICSTLIVEEMSELTKELMKNIRGNDNIDNIIEEIADVQLTLLNLINCLDVAKTVNDIMNNKYARTYERYVEPTLSHIV